MSSLAQTKCFNHGAREAVARCPECKRHYCRECVTEHEHRLLCAGCISTLATGEETGNRRLPFRAALQFSSALIMLWVGFYIMGQMLLLIPSTYHDSGDSFLQQLETMERERKAEKATRDSGTQADSEEGESGGQEE